MTSSLSQPLLFIFIIVLGYTLKRFGIFSEHDGKVLSEITVNITMPAAIVAGFQSFEFGASLFLLLVLGILINAVLMGAGYLSTRKQSKEIQGFAIFNTSTYNIGNFTFPYVQTLFGSPGLVAASIFDLGNALMTTGLVYSVGSSIASNQRPNIKDILKKLLHSMPFLTYLAMIFLSFIGLNLPIFFVDWMQTIGKANPIVAMLMIGIMLDIRFEKGWIAQAMKVVGIRFVIATIFSVLTWHFSSFPNMIKVTLIMLYFSPVASISTAYTQQNTDKGALSSFTSSVSVVLSTCCFLFLVPLLYA